MLYSKEHGMYGLVVRLTAVSGQRAEVWDGEASHELRKSSTFRSPSTWERGSRRRRQLRRLVDAGFGKRVMFGSDQMVWPGVIEPAIAIIEEAPFLSREQKRDILYNNAARFLRLSTPEIVRPGRR